MAFFTILTAIGQAKIANAAALGQTLRLAEIALGDGAMRVSLTYGI